MTHSAITEELSTHVAELDTWPLSLVLAFARGVRAALEGDPSVAKHVTVVDAPAEIETPPAPLVHEREDALGRTVRTPPEVRELITAANAATDEHVDPAPERVSGPPVHRQGPR